MGHPLWKWCTEKCKRRPPAHPPGMSRRRQKSTPLKPCPDAEREASDNTLHEVSLRRIAYRQQLLDVWRVIAEFAQVVYYYGDRCEYAVERPFGVSPSQGVSDDSTGRVV